MSDHANHAPGQTSGLLNKLSRILCSLLIVCACLPIFTNAQSSRGPSIVNVGLYLKHLRVDESNSTFEASAYYWYTVQKRGDLPKSYYDSITSLEFVNAVSLRDSVIETKWIEGGQTYYKTGIINGTFYFSVDLKKYPKDVQKIPFIIESRLSTIKDLELRPHGGPNVEYDSTIKVQGKHIDHSEASVDTSGYNTDFGDVDVGKKQYSRYIATYFVKRPGSHFWIKIVIPNLFLLIIAYLVFFIPAKELEVAVGCTVTSLLASIALKWSIDNSLPSASYTTSADRLFYLFYFLITLALVESVITYNLNRRGRLKKEKVVEFACQVAYPVILFFGIIAIMISGD
jgi:hypothetical protein